MTIHKEGYTTIAVSVLFIFIVNAVIDYKFADITWLRYFVYLLSLVLFVTVLQFFRNPSRSFTLSHNQIICPADGKVVVIEETEEGEYFKDKRLQVSIFMSPVNVHINRNPISGIVKFFKYHPGKYLAAWNPKSSTENERTTVVVEHENGTAILYRQIAGALARRIVWYVKEGDAVEQGKEFGFIKFGSRVDLFLPLGTKVDLQLNQVVKGGITVLGELS
ncbi:phosphatidylserine decarboxylase family protein [Pedobacter sp. MC2016-14]|uniref:phosphatidylserine decarboxylase family protein n=1 Tax=Pedobacter sp. MC2016-14 TaxID=2897327 RepID=UPI001E3F288E|nr:phosphatidylserine decarboxylase family protein [Pedobacter sp. MC2016-14]MCD0487268.1 phosphatidylserine decarboxylase family protein [Pedobacter sp. MC2016-14]